MTISLQSKPVLVGAAIIVASFIMSIEGRAAPRGNSTVEVTVTDIGVQDGFMMIAMFDESGWGAAPVDAARHSVNGDTVTVTLAAPAPGRYGIRLFHDVDGNGELNTNAVGIPSEPYGFSNNAPARFGPPSFEAAAFDIGGKGAEQTISLQ